ncbi:carboxypeptidase regulatory-like domain-containing protein [Gemmatimonadota bacterium]
MRKMNYMIALKAISGRGSLLTVLAALGLLFGAGPAQSQVVQGRVVEAIGQQPVSGASVMLLDTAFAVMAGATSNSTGVFQVDAPRPGAYYILTEALGYEPSMNGILELGEGGMISVELYLKPKPIVLDSMKIAVERKMVFEHLERWGYYERQTTGFGHFITPEEIRQRNPRYYSDLFRNAPGVRVEGASNASTLSIANASIRGATCAPNVYVDGILIYVSEDFGGLQGAVDITQISGVEVYTRASNVPLEWGGTGSACGVVLIWTR